MNNDRTTLRTAAVLAAGLLALGGGVASASGDDRRPPSLEMVCRQQGGRLLGTDSVAPRCVHARVGDGRVEEAAAVCEARRGILIVDLGNGRRGTWTCDLSRI